MCSYYPNGAESDPNAPFNQSSAYTEDDYTRYTITIDVTLNTLEYDADTYIKSLMHEKLTDEDLGEILHSIKLEEVK